MFGATTGLQTHIWNTNARCVVLLALYPFIVLATAWLICAGLTLSAGRPDWAATASALLAQAWPAVLAAVGAWFLISWLWHTRMVRAMARSRPVTREEAPALYNALENLCISRGLPMPQLEIMETSARNAFASGIGPRSYTITVTRGLVDDLKPDELEAVLAHELAHILHGDVRLLIVAVIFTGAFSFAAQMAWRSLRYGVGRTRGGKGGLAIVAVAVALSVGWVFAVLVRYALSRRREYMADAGAVDLTRNPEALMRALKRLGAKALLNTAPPDIALMATHSEARFLGLFATHPPLEDRIAVIAALTNTPVPEVQEEWLSQAEVAQVLVRERLKRNPWFRGRD